MITSWSNWLVSRSCQFLLTCVRLVLINVDSLIHMCVCLCVFVSTCVYACLRPFTVKASSVWISWNAWKQISVYLCVFVSTCVYACLRPFTVKASSVWISWNAWKQIKKPARIIKYFLFISLTRVKSLKLTN